MTERRCYTPEEYAASRKISVRTVYRHIKAGKFGASLERVGRQYRIWIARTTHDTTRQDRTKPFHGSA